eukprot:111817-Prymnesium_polylepis.1
MVETDTGKLKGLPGTRKHTVAAMCKPHSRSAPRLSTVTIHFRPGSATSELAVCGRTRSPVLQSRVRESVESRQEVWRARTEISESRARTQYRRRLRPKTDPHACSRFHSRKQR